jgi:hypothetical protein
MTTEKLKKKLKGLASRGDNLAVETLKYIEHLEQQNTQAVARIIQLDPSALDPDKG